MREGAEACYASLLLRPPPTAGEEGGRWRRPDGRRGAEKLGPAMVVSFPIKICAKLSNFVGMYVRIDEIHTTTTTNNRYYTEL